MLTSLSSMADWEVNMPRGVSPTANAALFLYIHTHGMSVCVCVCRSTVVLDIHCST